ncbi:MAG: alpha/beta hydrolase [Acidobacteria bacterium]|nr:alpha/beta hydrolase [Acidobacteriota bacterium]
MITGSNDQKLFNLIIPGAGLQPELNAVSFGEQPQILLVHGANSTLGVWRLLMNELSSCGISSAAVELRGHGGSGGKDDLQSFGIEDYVDDVLRTLEHFPSMSVLVGHSMGGLVAQLAAARKPLAGLILLASSPVGGMRSDGTRMFLRHPLRFAGAMWRKSFAHLYRDAAVCRSLLFSRYTPESVIRDFMDSVQEESWRAGNEMNTLLPDPQAVKCPVLVIGGEDDFMVSAESVRATAEAYGTEAIFLPRAGHMVQLEGDPSSLARLIVDFSARVRSENQNA